MALNHQKRQEPCFCCVTFGNNYLLLVLEQAYDLINVNFMYSLLKKLYTLTDEKILKIISDIT